MYPYSIKRLNLEWGVRHYSLPVDAQLLSFKLLMGSPVLYYVSHEDLLTRARCIVVVATNEVFNWSGLKAFKLQAFIGTDVLGHSEFHALELS